MKKLSIFANQTWSKEMCLAHALEQGFTHYISQSFDDEIEAYKFSEKMQKHWRTNADGLTKSHRTVYGYTTAYQWESIDCNGQYVVLLLINAGSDFSKLLSGLEVGLVEPLLSTLTRCRPAIRQSSISTVFGNASDFKE